MFNALIASNPKKYKMEFSADDPPNHQLTTIKNTLEQMMQAAYEEDRDANLGRARAIKAL